MHICFLCSEYPPINNGGVGAYTQSLGRGLVKKGHDVTVIGFYRQKSRTEENDEGVKLIKLPDAKLPGIKYYQKARMLEKEILARHKESSIDLIEGPNSANALLSSKLPMAVLMRFHGGHRYFAHTTGRKTLRRRILLEDRALKNSDFYCSVSKFNAQANKILLAKPDMPIDVIYNSVDTDIFTPDPQIKPVKGLFLFIGTIAEKKGVKQLIGAIPTVLEQNPTAALWLVGKDWIDKNTGRNLRKDLEKEIPDKFKDRVVFKGPKPHNEIKDLMNTAEICVFPSLMEAHPVVWLEAMSCARPIVASNTGAAEEIITHLETGFLCNPYRPEKIAEALLYMLEHREEAKEMGLKARTWIIENLSRDQIINENIAMFERIVDEHKSKKSIGVS